MKFIPRLFWSCERRGLRSSRGRRSLPIQFPWFQPRRIGLPIGGASVVVPWAVPALRLRREAWTEYLCTQRWGRGLLHIIVLLRKRRDVLWHLRAIAREFRRRR